MTRFTWETQLNKWGKPGDLLSDSQAMDIWMSTCLVFVFAALLEFAIVNVLQRKETRRMVTMRRTTTRAKCNGSDVSLAALPRSGRVRRGALRHSPHENLLGVPSFDLEPLVAGHSLRFPDQCDFGL